MVITCVLFPFCKLSSPAREAAQRSTLACPPPHPLPPCWAFSSAVALQLLLGKAENHSYAAPNRPASCLRNDRGPGPSPERLGHPAATQPVHVQGRASEARRAERPLAVIASKSLISSGGPDTGSQLANIEQSAEVWFGK